MNQLHIQMIAEELNLSVAQVEATARLLAEGGTVPFIARYRKEATGMLDEVAITAVRDRLEQLAARDLRREAILKSLEERNLLTEELKKKIHQAKTMTKLEDIFQPFRPKRRTRATIAKEKGLEPLADFIVSCLATQADPMKEAVKYLNAEKEVSSVEDALSGARDILAERVSDDSEARTRVRALIEKEADVTSKVVASKASTPDAAKFKDYFEWSEPLSKIPSHRLLAIRRGENEGFLMMRLSIPEERAISRIEPLFVKGSGPCADQVSKAVQDGYKRLLGPSLETEARLESKKRADDEAVRVFAENLRELLLAAPLGQKRVLGIDPGLRTGCKVVCLDAQGKLLYNDVVYLVGSGSSLTDARNKLHQLVEKYSIEAIAIGNGTGSRETELFVNKIGLPKSVLVMMVNESGASIYSASDVARQEFPDHDITVRGAVSIGRRLMDPLAELVKIDPKSIGVGQYQHDVDQAKLKQALDDIVISCVNRVGVEVNTASQQLLAYVSGLNQTLASNIVKYRSEKGPFRSRKELMKVSRLGDKAFEQSAGFLRIHKAKNPLDASAVHPERYDLVERMAKDIGCSVEDLIRDASLRQKIQLERYVSSDVGLPTLRDIVEELARPGRDPRQKFEAFQFAEGVEKLEDLQVGMKLPGIVTNVTNFGAFVDVGVHQDGLVHISQLADTFVKDPAEFVKVQQKVQVTVIELDLDRKRVALSMKSEPDFDRTQNNRTERSGEFRSSPKVARSEGGAAKGGNTDDWFTQAMSKPKK